MVAAWINAETGVGPSIASGNQTCRGNCADFPTAPQKIKSEAVVRNAGWLVKIDNREAISAKTTDPVAAQTIKMPSMNPKSPMRVVINAFFSASAAASRSNQWPIKTQEVKPTSSQKVN